jgi:hypothetical protein
LLHSNPWPAAQWVIVAGDRDPSGTGEAKAREFCANQLGANLQTGIALPPAGADGAKVDWLDVLRRDGVEAVRAGIMSAVEFKATDANLGQRAERQQRESELDQIRKDYPLPKAAARLHYDRCRDGEIWAHTDGEPFASPFTIKGFVRQIDNENTYALRIVFRDLNGNPREVDINRKELAGLGGRDVLSHLYDHGFRVVQKGDIEFIQILSINPEREITTVQSPGWHKDIAGISEPIFVTPGGEIFGVIVGQRPNETRDGKTRNSGRLEKSK